MERGPSIVYNREPNQKICYPGKELGDTKDRYRLCPNSNRCAKERGKGRKKVRGPLQGMRGNRTPPETRGTAASPVSVSAEEDQRKRSYLAQWGERRVAIGERGCLAPTLTQW